MPIAIDVQCAMKCPFRLSCIHCYMIYKKCSYNMYTTLKAIYVRTQAIRLILRANVLIGNIQICILRCVLQQSRVVSLHAYIRMARITHYKLFLLSLYLYTYKRMVRVTYMPAAKSVLLYLTMFDACHVLFRMSISGQEGFWCAWQVKVSSGSW